MPKLSTKSMKNKLEQYLSIQNEIKCLEETASELKKELFSEENVGNLPYAFSCSAGDFILQSRTAPIPLTIGILQECGVDINMIVPMATFSKTLCKNIFGSSFEKKLAKSDTYREELENTEKSYFYKRA